MLLCSIHGDMSMRCVMLSCVGTASAMVRAQLQIKILPNVKKIFSTYTSFNEERHNSEGRRTECSILIEMI